MLVWAAIPKHEKINSILLRPMLKAYQSLVRETDDFYFIPMMERGELTSPRSAATTRKI